jgi:hypothetical protein
LISLISLGLISCHFATAFASEKLKGIHQLNRGWLVALPALELRLLRAVLRSLLQ